ncbi:hypothetical protein K440DRAFT_34281 [Wilcoxina mikolae CBS 423.85]|nr:hypothetical protein K440DRAFT_34281 [Wilcoxina mikolae CBS 423.85]
MLTIVYRNIVDDCTIPNHQLAGVQKQPRLYHHRSTHTYLQLLYHTGSQQQHILESPAHSHHEELVDNVVDYIRHRNDLKRPFISPYAPKVYTCRDRAASRPPQQAWNTIWIQRTCTK